MQDIVVLLRGLVFGEHINHKAADTIDYLREKLRFAERNWRECRQEIARLEEQLAKLELL
jgi:polyhydroxyalkanoate synthesis regulator phasin